MNVVTCTGILAACALLIPVVIIFTYRLALNRSLFVLAIYFLFAAFCNLMAEGVINIDGGVENAAVMVNNYLDAPMILFSFQFFCTTATQRMVLRIILIAFVFFELIVSMYCGLSIESVVYILGPGIVILFFYALYFFVKYARIAIEKNKQVGKTLMLSSISFAYGCYGMVYCFYYIQKTPARADALLIYYIASILASVMMSVGLGWLSKQSKKIKEVQITRRELALFFNH